MTSLLLDAHTLLWFLWDDPMLSAAAKSHIENAQNRKLVSVATCWEIAIKTGLRKLDVGEPCRTFLPRELHRNHFELLPIRLEHVAAVEELPNVHGDPFDRLLIAQSLAEGYAIVGIDKVLDRYGVTRLW